MIQMQRRAMMSTSRAKKSSNQPLRIGVLVSKISFELERSQKRKQEVGDSIYGMLFSHYLALTLHIRQTMLGNFMRNSCGVREAEVSIRMTCDESGKISALVVDIENFWPSLPHWIGR